MLRLVAQYCEVIRCIPNFVTPFLLRCTLCFNNLAQAAPLIEYHSAQDGDAQFRLGYQYERGDNITGITQDYQAAMKLYLAGPQLGNDQTMFRIGVHV